MRLPRILLLPALAALVHAAPALSPAPDDPAWARLAATFAHPMDATANFTERRFFPFRKTPLKLSGVSRVSPGRGLSLDYTTPEQRTVILDERGTIVREASGDSPAPSDPRASGANAALVRILRFDLRALAADFALSGRRDGDAWTLTLVPRAEELRRTIAAIEVAGGSAEIRRIVIRHSPKHYVEITIGPARPTPFTPGELQRYFR